MKEKRLSLYEICTLVEGRIYTDELKAEGVELSRAFSSDLMSDVLTLLTDDLLLLTGLNNIQAVRTAEMADIAAILFVRGKEPTEKMIELAESAGLVLMASPHSMYRAGGELYSAGLGHVY